jgi:hypothetical protein
MRPQHQVALSVLAVLLLIVIGIRSSGTNPATNVQPETATSNKSDPPSTPTPEELAAENAAREARMSALKAQREKERIAALWARTEDEDPLTGARFVTLVRRSTYSFELDFPHRGMHYGYLAIRKHPRHGTDVMVYVDDGQLHCTYNDCKISVRFDADKPRSFAVTGPADASSSTWFVDDKNRFLARLSKADNVIVELQFYRQGIRTLKFETTGFKRP